MDADQFRMARAAVDMPIRELARLAGCNKADIVDLENRRLEHRRSPQLQERIQQEVATVLGRYVIFIEATEEHGPGVMLRPGMVAGCWRDKPRNGLDPVDEGGAQLLEYFRARREDWNSLPEEARAALLGAIYGAVPDVDPLTL